MKWWRKRKENENAWLVSIDDVICNDYSLDFANPSRPDASLPDDPQELLKTVLSTHQQISADLEVLEQLLRGVK